MRPIKRIFIHCSATPADMYVDAALIHRWHTDPKPQGRGWSDIGYHFVLPRDGTIEAGRPVALIGAHVLNHNRDSIGICLAGGVAADGKTPEANFTAAQMRGLRLFLIVMKATYGLTEADIVGHRDAPGVAKACPSFDVAHWLATEEVRP